MNVHIYPSYFTNESRILRSVQTVVQHKIFDDVLIVAAKRSDLPFKETLEPNIRVERISPVFGKNMRGSLGKWVKAFGWYLGVFRHLRDLPIRCLNAHSLSVLPIAIILKEITSCSVVYDTHELETETVSSKGLRLRFARIIERILIKRCDAVCVVNQSIAKWYRQKYELKNVTVVRNIPRLPRERLEATSRLRRALFLDDHDDSLIFLYQGLLGRGRGIDLLLKVFSCLDSRYIMVFMGYGELEFLVKNAALKNSNIRFVPAVSPARLFDYTADADVGLSLIENICLNYYLSLPNKIFEYAVCGVPSLVSNFPEMSAYIAKTGFGWDISPTFDSVYKWVTSVNKSQLEEKKIHIQKNLSCIDWHAEESELLGLYEQLGFISSLDADRFRTT